MNAPTTIQKREYVATFEGGVSYTLRDAETPLSRQEYDGLLEQMQVDIADIESKLQKLQTQLGEQSKEDLSEIQQSMIRIHATTFCHLPFYGPQEQ